MKAMCVRKRIKFNQYVYTNKPGLNRIIDFKHPNSALSTFMSLIFTTTSERTRSKIWTNPAWMEKNSICKMLIFIFYYFLNKTLLISIPDELNACRLWVRWLVRGLLLRPWNDVRTQLLVIRSNLWKCTNNNFLYSKRFSFVKKDYFRGYENQPARRRTTRSVSDSSLKCGTCLAHSTNWKSCLSAAWKGKT